MELFLQLSLTKNLKSFPQRFKDTAATSLLQREHDLRAAQGTRRQVLKLVSLANRKQT